MTTIKSLVPVPPNAPTLRIYVLPISGKGITVQIGQAAFIASGAGVIAARGGDQTLRSPDAVFSGSGGNIAAYIGASSDWQRDRILTTVRIIRSDAFVTSWAGYAPSWVFLPLVHSLFRPGYGFRQIFRQMFTSDKCAEAAAEIWTGAFHKSSRQLRLFTNKREGGTIFTPTAYNGQMFIGDHIPPIYVNGDLDDIANITLASASIPWLSRAVVVRGEEYSDCGTSCASPLTVLAENVKNFASDAVPAPELRRIRLTYFSPDTLSKFGSGGILDSFAEIGSLLQSVGYHDVRTFIAIMTFLGAPTNGEPEEYNKLTPAQYADLIEDLEANTIHYGVILFPSSFINRVNFISATPNDFYAAATAASEDVNAFVWRAL